MYLAQFKASSGEIKGAVELYNKAIQMGGDRASINYTIAQLYQSSGSFSHPSKTSYSRLCGPFAINPPPYNQLYVNPMRPVADQSARFSIMRRSPIIIMPSGYLLLQTYLTINSQTSPEPVANYPTCHLWPINLQGHHLLSQFEELH